MEQNEKAKVSKQEEIAAEKTDVKVAKSEINVGMKSVEKEKEPVVMEYNSSEVHLDKDGKRSEKQ